MRKLSALFLTTAFLAALTLTPVRADERHEHHEEWHAYGDIHHFHEHDYNHWREGEWRRGYHEGRDGWWWVIGGLWYYYPAPIYPYPDPYTPPTVIIESAPVAPTAIAPPSSVYHCANPEGYYPYVSQCYEPWQRIEPTSVAPQVVQPPIVSAPPSEPTSRRQKDDRQLNAYAVALNNINLESPQARAKLQKLERKVETFRQALLQRTYNAMDILRDTEDLEHRIYDQRHKLPPS